MEMRDHAYYKEISGRSAALNATFHPVFKELIRMARQEDI